MDCDMRLRPRQDSKKAVEYRMAIKNEIDEEASAIHVVLQITLVLILGS